MSHRAGRERHPHDANMGAMSARLEQTSIANDPPASGSVPTHHHERQHPMTDTHHASDAMNAAIRQRGHQPQPEGEQDNDEQEQSVPSFDGGARTTAPVSTGNMNALIRGKVDRWHRGE